MKKWIFVLAGIVLLRATAYTARLGTPLAVVVLAGFATYLGSKLVRWHRFVREFRMAQITPEELKEKLDAGEKVTIVELHVRRGASRGHQGIPGSVCIDPQRLEQYDTHNTRAPIPRDREVVLYCAAPHDLTSARVAFALHRRGFERVRPLAGGLRAWHERGFPLTLVILCGAR
jgi:rhodanese-related sulfurtransferase